MWGPERSWVQTDPIFSKASPNAQASPCLCLFARAAPSPRLSFPPPHPAGSVEVSSPSAVSQAWWAAPGGTTHSRAWVPAGLCDSAGSFRFRLPLLPRGVDLFKLRAGRLCPQLPTQAPDWLGRRPNLPGYGVPSEGQYGRSVCFRIQNTPDNTHLLTTSPAWNHSTKYSEFLRININRSCYYRTHLNMFYLRTRHSGGANVPLCLY